MNRSICLLSAAVVWLALLASSFAPAVATAPGSSPDPLRLDQIEQLLEIGIPDRALVKEIEKRGLGFRLNRELLDRLVPDKTKPLSRRALEERLSLPSLLVKTKPAVCKVYLDDGYRGVSDTAGKLLLEGLSPGPHHLSVKREQSAGIDVAQEADVTLKPGADDTVELDLGMKPGWLSVSTAPPAVTLVISGRQFTSPITRQELDAGEQDIVAKCPVCVSRNEHVWITSGQETSINLILAVDEPAFRQKMKDAERKMVAEEFADARRIAQELKLNAPTDPLVVALSAETSYAVGQYAEFLDELMEGLELDAVIRPQVQFYDPRTDKLSRGTLNISRTAVGVNGAHPSIHCPNGDLTVATDELDDPDLHEGTETYLQVEMKHAEFKIADLSAKIVTGRHSDFGLSLVGVSSVAVNRLQGTGSTRLALEALRKALLLAKESEKRKAILERQHRRRP